MSEAAIKSKSPAKSIRRRARELALQGIYQWRLTGGAAAQIEKQIREEKGMGRYDADFFCALLHGVLTQHATLEAAVTRHLDRTLDELSPIEFSVLLLGAYELLHHPEIPYRVIINEAVELTKTFGGTDGHKYVNGVLDKMAAQVRATEAR
ncbi:MAG: transcription antitermination factor NusB [Gallionellaceae bacterium]|nr:transcription antitermination factor NusB [Gallionellaceae bacterium]